MAPEKIEQKDGYDLKSDIWSLGITALEITSGDVPYSNLSPMKAMMNIFNNEEPSLNKYEKWSPEFRAFVTDCLQKDPNARINSENILVKHRKFFNKALDKEIIKKVVLFGGQSLWDKTPQSMK